MIRHSLIVLFILGVTVLSELINKYEGAKCSWRNVSGTCVNIFKCESAPVYLKNKDYPPICTFQGEEPVICCTDCTMVEDTRKIIMNPTAGQLILTGQKANDKCVNFVDKLDYDCKIGQTASYKQLFYETDNCYLSQHSLSFHDKSLLPPERESYLALLGYGDDMNTAQWLCAGSIISEKFILTVAHCLNNDELGQVKFVALGILNRTDSPDLWQKYKVKRIIPHPEYKSPSKYHDIALLETETTITFSREVIPACLHSDPQTFIVPADLLTWSPDQGDLVTISLEEFDSIQCSFFYPPHDKLAEGFNDSTQICYGHIQEPEDSCQSDSGSPLMAVYGAFSCAKIILGVMSIDRTCGTKGSSAMFTKVMHYVPWIESIVWP